jgi:hypothetical protein
VTSAVVLELFPPPETCRPLHNTDALCANERGCNALSNSTLEGRMIKAVLLDDSHLFYTHAVTKTHMSPSTVLHEPSFSEHGSHNDTRTATQLQGSYSHRPLKDHYAAVTPSSATDIVLSVFGCAAYEPRQLHIVGTHNICTSFIAHFSSIFRASSREVELLSAARQCWALCHAR